MPQGSLAHTSINKGRGCGYSSLGFQKKRVNSKSDWHDRMRWLDDKSRPLIRVGVGASLPRPVRPGYWISPSGPAPNRSYAAPGRMTGEAGSGTTESGCPEMCQ